MFQLHPQLQHDCRVIGRFPLCHTLLMNEARYPWLILVPERAGISEIYQLSSADRAKLIEESSALARALAQAFRPDKLNIATIGNRVPQLHVHHVVRYRDDPAWPAPVWGRFEPQPYDREAHTVVLDKLKAAMPPDFEWHIS